MMLSTTVPASTTNVSPGLSASWSYRQRIPLTASSVIAGVCGTLLTAPVVVEGTLWDRWCDGFALGLLVAAIVLRLWAASHISGRKSKSLVATGPYAICRNPLYVGTLLMAISQMLILKSLAFAVACLVPVVLYAVNVVAAEEQILLHRLGAKYRDYCQLVPRWIPRWRALNFDWKRPESTAAFRAECVRSAWWILLPIVSEFIAGLRGWIWSVG